MLRFVLAVALLAVGAQSVIVDKNCTGADGKVIPSSRLAEYLLWGLLRHVSGIRTSITASTLKP